MKKSFRATRGQRRKNYPDLLATLALHAVATILDVTPNLVTLLTREEAPLFKLVAAVEHVESVERRPLGVHLWRAVECSKIDLPSFGHSGPEIDAIKLFRSEGRNSSAEAKHFDVKRY